MEITRINDAGEYDAPGHFNMTARRIQGLEASGAETCSVGFSTFLPGGGCESSSTPFEKIYVILSGEISVTVADGSYTLGKYDSCRIEPGEARTMLNESSDPCEVLVIIPAN